MKKTALVLLSVMVLTVPFIMAQTEGVPPDFQPIAAAFQILLDKINVVVGGIFGLYLIFILFRIHHERQKVKLLKSILYNLDQLNKYHHLPIAKEKKGFWSRLFRKDGAENDAAERKPVSPQKSKKNLIPKHL